MTITIHRPIWQQRFVILLGLAAFMGAVAIAVFQNADTEPGEANMPAVSVIGDSGAYWKSLQLLQDGFLPPAVAAESADYWMRFQEVQDGYLPPAVGLSDSRTNGPR